MDKGNIELYLSPAEVDFIANVISQVPYGSVARSNMLPLLGKIVSQASVTQQLPLPTADEKGNGVGITPPL